MSTRSQTPRSFLRYHSRGNRVWDPLPPHCPRGLLGLCQDGAPYLQRDRELHVVLLEIVRNGGVRRRSPRQGAAVATVAGSTSVRRTTAFIETKQRTKTALWGTRAQIHW